MKKKTSVFLALFLVFYSPTTLNATYYEEPTAVPTETYIDPMTGLPVVVEPEGSYSTDAIYDENYVIMEPDSQICSNVSYFIDSENEQLLELIILDTATNQVLDVFNFNDTQEIILPSNVSQITLMITPIVENQGAEISQEKRINYQVSDCGYEPVTTDYVLKNMDFTVTYDGTNIQVDFDETSDVILEYQFLDSKQIHEITAEDKTIEMEEHEIVQILEIKEDEEGNTVNSYYEIEVNPETGTYIVRNVDSFELKSIDMSYINKKYLVLLIFFIILYIFVSRMHKRQKKEYMHLKQKVYLHYKKKKERRKFEKTQERRDE